MLIQTTGTWAALRWLAAIVLALWPAAARTPAATPQAAPVTVNGFAAPPSSHGLGPAVLPTTQFDSANYSGGESDGTAPFTVTLSAASGITVTVVYTTVTGGTATPGADYVAATGTLTFTPGLTATQGTLTLLPDLLDELDETVFISLTSPSNATLGLQGFTRFSILDDDDPPTVLWDASAYTATEGAASALLTATLTAASGLTVTVAFTTTAGSATPGSDYVTTAALITFTPGSQSAQAAVPLLADLADEPDETFTVTLGAPANAALGAPSDALVTILDNDAPPTVQLSAAIYNTPESATTLPFTVTLSAATGLTVTVTYTTTDGTATPGGDYTAATGTLTVTPGLTATQGTITLLPDGGYEPAETFGLALSAPSNAALGAITTATVIIADDDTPPTAQFTGAAYLAAEADLTLPFTVTLSAAANVTVTVAYTTVAGTATAGNDYVHASGLLTFTAGVTTTQGAVTLLPDTLFEPTENFSLELGGPSNATLGVPNLATISIVEDDPTPTAQFAAANASVSESATTAPFTVTLSGAAGLTITVAYSTTAGSATPGGDFAHATGVLTFTPGLTATQGTLTLLPDNLDEDDETLFVVITQTTIALLGAPATTRLTIVDDDPPPSVQWSAAAYTATEAVGSLTLTVTLSAPSGLTVTVAYTSAPGAALAGADYLTATGVLTFSPGQTTQTLLLTIVADDAPEPVESLAVSLGSPANAALGAPSATTVTIVDDDLFRVYLPLMIKLETSQHGYRAGRTGR